MEGLGRLLLLLAGILAVAGAFLLIAARLRIPLGHLPGDIVYRGRNTTIYVPWVTMLILSAVLTLVVRLLRR